LSEFKDVFEGIGKLPGGKYHIELKPDAQPVQHPPRAVPEKKKEAYKNELERLCSLGIIEPVAGHTDWINSIVPVAKPDGSIRLCLDPKDLNILIWRRAEKRKLDRNRPRRIITIRKPSSFKIYSNTRMFDYNWILINQYGRKPQWFSNPPIGHPDVIKCRPNLERDISETVDTCVLQFRATNQKI